MSETVGVSKTSSLKTAQEYVREGKADLAFASLLVKLVGRFMESDAEDAKTVAVKTVGLMRICSVANDSIDKELRDGYAAAAGLIVEMVRRDGKRGLPYSIFTSDEFFGLRTIGYLEREGNFELALDKLLFNMVNGFAIEKKLDGYQDLANMAVVIWALRAERVKTYRPELAKWDLRFARYIQGKLPSVLPRVE